jgi:uncharacterized protein (DUF433 family)
MGTSSLLERIVANPKIFGGKPIIRGTRIPVESVLALLAQGMTVDDLIADYGNVVREDILACIEFAHAAIANESIEAVEIVKA